MKSSSHTDDQGIFGNLAQLPLLKGVTQARLREVVGTMRFHFHKLASGDTVVDAGTDCRSLLFVLNGSVRLSTSLTDVGDLSFTFAQTLKAPQVITPEHLFGLSTSYPCTATAITDVGLMEISKEDFRRMLALDSVFLFNYLNTVCARAQRAQSGLPAIACGSNAERLAYWVTTLSQPEATDIELHSHGRELHQVFGMSPAALRSAVEKLDGLVTLTDPNTLHAPSRSPLRDLLLMT